MHQIRLDEGYLLPRFSNDVTGEVRTFSCISWARYALLPSLRDPFFLLSARDFLAQSGLHGDLSRMDEQEVVEELARMLVAGDLLLVVPERVRHPVSGGQGRAAPDPVPAPPPPKKASSAGPIPWIEIELLGEDGMGVPFERYLITSPGGKVVAQGKLDTEGLAHVTGMDAGSVLVAFPDLDGEAWEKA